MSDVDTIKEFLVALGFKVDESSFKKFGSGIEGATKQVALLGAGVATAAVATETFVTRMADSLDRLYFATQRTGASASEIGDFQLAVQRLGGSAEGALSSMESLARFRRTTPGADGLLESWGVSPKDIGNAEKSLEDLAVHFRQIPEALAYQEAGILGIDEKTLLAMLNPDFHVGHDVADMYRAIGVNQQDALKGAHDFQVQLRTMSAEFGVFGTWIETQLVGPMERFNDILMDGARGLVSFGDLIKKYGVSTVDQGIGADIADRMRNAGLPQPLIDLAFGHVSDFAAKSANTISGVLGLSSQSQNAAAQNAMAYFQRQGWPAAAAAGIVGNLIQESGFKPAASNGSHAGIAQWDARRQAEFRHLYGKDIASASMEEQLAYVNYELTQGQYKAVGDALRSTTDPLDASDIAQDRYEVAIGQDTWHREMYAHRAYNAAGAQVSAPVTINVTGANDPKATAAAVADAQKGVTEHLVGAMSRQFGGTQ